MRKFILDTDMGCDCDDVGALAIMLNAVNNGDAELLAVTHAINDIYGLRFTTNMLKQYGISVPVCKCAKPGFMQEGSKNVYDYFIKPFAEESKETDYPDSLAVMRKLLAENGDVTIITIGSFVNLAALLASAGDSISHKNGKELVRDSVKCVYSMAGDFSGSGHREFNIVCDIAGAVYVAKNCPVQIIYSGFEIGKDIITGAHLKTAPQDRLIKKAYSTYNRHNAYSRPSWDPATVYQALYPENGIFSLSENVTVTFDGEGRTVFTRGGKDRYMLINSDVRTAEEELNRMMV